MASQEGTQFVSIAGTLPLAYRVLQLASSSAMHKILIHSHIFDRGGNKESCYDASTWLSRLSVGLHVTGPLPACH
jgi:hypothetical protein